MKRRTLRLARIAISAAVYIAMSLAIMPLTFGLIQIRFSEMLILLCFYDRDYCYAMVLGCIVTNFFSPLGIIDVLFGTCGTLISVIAIRYIRRIYLAWIPPTICTALVALEFYITASEPFWLSWGTIALGEFLAVAVVGVPVFMLLERNRKFLEIIGVDARYESIMASIEAKRARRKDARNIRLKESENNVKKEISGQNIENMSISEQNMSSDIDKQNSENIAKIED